LNYCFPQCRNTNRSGLTGHVHEFLGSTRISGPTAHNHRFAGISGPPIPTQNNHVHEIITRTDDAVNHHHSFRLFSGPAINVGNGRHVHFARGETTFVLGHDHRFIFTTLIEEPIDRN